MADAADSDELAMRVKRKTDPTFEDKDQKSNKFPKDEAVHTDSLSDANDREHSATNQNVRDISESHSAAGQENGKVGAGLDEGEDEEDGYSDSEEEDYDEEDDEDDPCSDEDDENSEGSPKLDHKGKGIMKNDKGKGKLIEEVQDDSSSSGSELDDQDSDMSDDPLAEVDLNNILPSRTRRRTIRPGLCIANDLKNGNDDSDA